MPTQIQLKEVKTVEIEPESAVHRSEIFPDHGQALYCCHHRAYTTPK